MREVVERRNGGAVREDRSPLKEAIDYPEVSHRPIPEDSKNLQLKIHIPSRTETKHPSAAEQL